MSRRDIEAGRSHVTLWVKKSPFVKGLQAASQKMQSFGAGMMKIGIGFQAAGGLIVGAIGGAVSQFIAAGDALDKMSARTGITVGALSELGFAAKQSGTDIDTVEKSIRAMQKVLGDAADGTTTAVDALGKLGLTFAELNGLAPDKQFDAIVAEIAKISDPTLRAAAAMDIFGKKNGTAILPMIEGMADLRKEFRELGLPPTEEQTKRAAALGDAISRLKEIVAGAIFQIGDAFAPVLLKAAEAIQSVAVPVQKWIRDNQEIIRVVGAAGLALLAFGTGVTGIGTAIFLAGTAIAGFVSMASTIAAAVTAVGLPFIAGAALVFAYGAALTAAAGYWLVFTDSGQEAIAILQDIFGDIWGVGKDAIMGIVDALQRGDLGAAMEIAGIAVELAWIKTVNNLQGHWQEFIGKLYLDMEKGIAKIGEMVEKNLGRVVEMAMNPKAALVKSAVGIGKGGAAVGDPVGMLFDPEGINKQREHETEKRFEDALAGMRQRQAEQEAARVNRAAPVMAPQYTLDDPAADPRNAPVMAPQIAPGAVDVENAKAAGDSRYQKLLEQFRALQEQADLKAGQKADEAGAGLPDMKQSQSFVSFSAAGLGMQGQGGAVDKLVAKAEKQISLAEKAGEGIADAALFLGRIWQNTLGGIVD